MSSSPIKKYHTSEIIKAHLQKLKSLKDLGIISFNELAQIPILEQDLIEIEKIEKSKPLLIFSK